MGVKIYLSEECPHDVIRLLRTILKEVRAVTPELERLATEVAEMKTAQQSAVTLLSNLSELIRQHADDPAALRDLADQIDSSTNELSAAVTANTPAEPTPPA